MITYVTHMRVSAANRAGFEALMQELGEVVAKHEPGNHFGWGRSVNDPDLFVVVDIYPDAAAQAAHHAAPYVAPMLAKAAKLFEGGQYDAKRYES
jgi:quinol monooxygenase YgiN